MRAAVIPFWPTLNLHYEQREWGWEAWRDNLPTPPQFPEPLKWQSGTTLESNKKPFGSQSCVCLMAPPDYCGPSGTFIVVVTSRGLLSDTFNWMLLQSFPINRKYDYKMVLCPWNIWLLPKYTARAVTNCKMPAQSRGKEKNCRMQSGGQSCCLGFLAVLMC